MKYAGLLLLVTGSFAVGRAYARALLYKVRLLFELSELVERLGEGARCYHRPYSRTLSELSQCDERVGELVAALLREENLFRGYSAWGGRRELPAEVDEILSALFRSLGGAELSRELELLSSARDGLRNIANSAESKAKSDGKAAVVTAVAAGLGLALLLL